MSDEADRDHDHIVRETGSETGDRAVTDSETVYVTTGQKTKRVYHTDAECWHVQQSKLHERALSALRDDARECSYCSGDLRQKDDTDRFDGHKWRRKIEQQRDDG